MSICMNTAYLRLQDIWLGKFIASGLLIPAGKLSAKQYVSDPSELVGSLVVLMVFSVITAGHLPLMMPLLSVSMLTQVVCLEMPSAKGVGGKQ